MLFRSVSQSRYGGWETKRGKTEEDNQRRSQQHGGWSISNNLHRKEPPWIEYTTDVNETYGEFAAGMPLAFMCLNRVYEESANGAITNPSTYIDPTIYNNIFAESRLSSQNFWVQVAFDVTARRVMSAKQIPNL